MRETGLIALIAIVFACIRDAYTTARAWQVMAGFALVFAMPVLLVLGLALLIF